MHTRAWLERFGAEAMIAAGLAIALIRETGPLTAGLLVSGRVGASIGAEIGAMRVNEQIDALEANAVDAFKYLAVTRISRCRGRLCLVKLAHEDRPPTGLRDETSYRLLGFVVPVQGAHNPQMDQALSWAVVLRRRWWGTPRPEKS